MPVLLHLTFTHHFRSVLKPPESRKNGTFGLRKIGFKRSSSLLRSSCLKRFQNGKVHFDIRRVQQFGVRKQPETQPQLGRNLRIEPTEPLAVGKIDNRRMENHVLAANRRPIAILGGFPRTFHGASHTRDCRVFRVGLGERLAFDNLADTVDVDDRGHARSCNEHTAVRLVPQQSFLGEQSERLAQRIARHIEISMADLCEEIGADIGEVSNGMGLDKRIGATFLIAGPGYGGSCFPKDTIALLRTAQEFGVPMRLVEQTISVNTARKRTLANRVRSMLNGELRNKKIAVFGLTFKANTDDMRDSPSLSLIRALQNDGAIVQAFDPEGVANARQLLHNVTFFQDPYECARGAEVVVLMTDWDCLLDLDFGRLAAIMRQKNVLDLRGIYDGDMLQRSHGFIVHTVGRQNTGTADIPKPEMQPVGRIAISGLLPLAKRELADVDTPPLPVMNAQLEELVDG
jgi:hypothetical protein